MTTTYLAYIPSPSQGVWHIGPVPLRAYALFIIVGIVVALVLGDRRWVARGGQAGVIYDIALWAVPFGLIGGRLYHVMTDWRTYFGEDGAGLAGALRIWDGGLGIWGAVALGGVGAWIGCRQKGIPVPAFGDAIAPGIILAQAIGRLGNYFNQELYGRPTTLPWGLEIYERRDASGALDTLNGASTGQLIEVVHPTFLYELLWNLLVFAALIYLDRRFKMGHGRLFATYVAGYCLGRFWIELMRSDVATHFAGIRVNSFTSTFVFIGAVVYIMVAPKGREDPATLVGKPETEDEFATLAAKELTAVAATTGVVAAAKAAGDVEDQDANAVGDVVDSVEDEPAVEDADAEALGADVAGVPAETVEEAEEFAAEGEEETEEPEGGLGAVEGDDVAEAVEAAPEVHDAEVEAVEEAEAVADELAAERAEADDVEGEEPESEPEPAVEGDEGKEESEPEAGLGAVEGDEVAEAVDAAPEVHDAAVEAADEAETVADEADQPLSEAAAEAEDIADAVAEAPAEDIEAAAEFAAAGEQADAVESDDSEPDEPETEAAEAAVGEASAEPTEEEAAEQAEAVDDEADSAAEDEPKTGVLEEAKVGPEPAVAPDPAVVPDPAVAPDPAVVRAPEQESGGRLSRWLRRNR
ncbi:prolipoprotein diacylglyceryl transferase [Mycobacterium sp. JS623]|uniref:prolipoprotein diacylglyceryl transferase n=1 Tax=Mycobacterium sp. JS623 TaxID=212767 RepID=UPI0002A5B311|nr:prolipoprotein diacylglyceryl transferase [Mycobacterium sp. JS623]AGB23310.1 prolipoprotein diacylglyceryl transferase [Mycobacterium sp. JS623]